MPGQTPMKCKTGDIDKLEAQVVADVTEDDEDASKRPRLSINEIKNMLEKDDKMLRDGDDSFASRKILVGQRQQEADERRRLQAFINEQDSALKEKDKLIENLSDEYKMLYSQVQEMKEQCQNCSCPASRQVLAWAVEAFRSELQAKGWDFNQQSWKVIPPTVSQPTSLMTCQTPNQPKQPNVLKFLDEWMMDNLWMNNESS